MLSNHMLKYHYHPEKGWLNDPNGLCYFKGEYHLFYQNAPHHEYPWGESMVWGHAKTKDFLHFEELPTALTPDMPYDEGGVWSGTAVEVNGKLYAFYASVDAERKQTISVAYSEDGVHFEKYAGNPIISTYPPDGSRDFRDPAILVEEDGYYLVIASADTKKGTGNLLLYKSEDLFHWAYQGVLHEYADCQFCECPSFVRNGDRYILSTSVCPKDGNHYFEVMCGDFDGKKFTPAITSHFQKGPDEYAGQIFRAPDGRAILISWVTGWGYQPKEKCIGCLSLPLEITAKGDTLTAYPVREVRHLLDENDTLVDGYVKETFVRGGEEVRIELTEKP